MTFTRSQFADACHKFVSKKGEEDNQNEFLSRGSGGWKWKTHSTIGNLGYLERAGYTFRLPGSHRVLQHEIDVLDGQPDITEDKDENTTPTDKSETLLTVQQHIAFSPTFQTPVFYFIIYSRDGAPLSLSEIMQTAFLRRDALPSDAEIAPHGISFHSTNFPVLSLGDHPVLGQPYWYLHPCQSSAAVDELLQSIPRPDGEDPLLSWLKTWLLVLKSIVDIR